MVAEQPWFGKAALAFQKRTLDRVENFSPEDFSKEALRLDREQRTFLERKCINLYPGTNILTPTVARLLGSTVASRAAEGHPGAKYQTGLHWVEEVEVIATELVRRVFDARYAEVRGLSGSMANAAVLNSLTEPGDTIFSFTAPAGGHIRTRGRAGHERAHGNLAAEPVSELHRAAVLFHASERAVAGAASPA